MEKVTISDVAREAGVSTQTVSRVLNKKSEISDSTRERVLAVIERLGYQPSRVARSLATQRTYTIGVTVPEIIHPFYAELVTSIQRTAWERGYSVFQILTSSDPDRELSALDTLANHWVDGMVCCRTQLDDATLLGQLRRFNAAVLVNRYLAQPGIGSVNLDDQYAMGLAVDHLRSVGCRHIAMLSGQVDSQVGRVRLDCFSAALKRAGWQGEPDILQSQLLNLVYDWSHDWLRRGLDPDAATVQLLQSYPTLDGLVCYNDIYAIGAIRALQRIGRRVPEDVAVVGVDDIPWSRLLSPSLTTLNAHVADMGAQAVRMVIDKIEGRGELTNTIMRHELIVRESTQRRATDADTPPALAHVG